MTPREMIHTFARRYCLERDAELRAERARVKQQNSLDEATHSPARLHVVEAILIEVERFTPDDFRSRQHAALRLMETGQNAKNSSTMQKVWQKPPTLHAMQEERDRFAESIRQFAAQKDWKCWRVEPLPYRRTLREEEREHLMAGLRKQWGITKRWWVPFDRYELPYKVLVLDSTAVRNELTTDVLRQILAQRGVERLYELWEYERQPDREIGLPLWEPYHGFWSEKYWLTDQKDWLFYTTHENSTTIAGDWLLAEIKAVWPDWEAHRWAAPWKQQE